MVPNRFNLIEEPWIPVVESGLTSLTDIFGNPKYRALGGNPVEKIAITKLLLAIAQATFTPVDDDKWDQLSQEEFGKNVLAYLEKWRDKFWLYGDEPFLQFPAMGKAIIKHCSELVPQYSTGNKTVLTQSNIARELSDAQKAILVVSMMGFALSGKNIDNSIVLSAGYEKKKSAKIAPSMGFSGYLHSFVTTKYLRETIWINLLSEKNISALPNINVIGTAPWEQMPAGEDDDIAQALKKSYMGRLVPLSRFCMLAQDGGIHFSGGITHQSHKDGYSDPSIAVNYGAKKAPTAIWVDPEKRPWHWLTALLSFLIQSNTTGFECQQLKYATIRAKEHLKEFGIWSGGLKVSSNAGEQYVSGSNDFVESVCHLHSDFFGEPWYVKFSSEVEALEKVSFGVYASTKRYFEKLNESNANQKADQAKRFFWELAMNKYQQLVELCGEIIQTQKSDKLIEMKKTFVSYAFQAYNLCCPKETARQLDAWAECSPIFSKYLKLPT